MKKKQKKKQGLCINFNIAIPNLVYLPNKKKKKGKRTVIAPYH